MLFNSFHFVVFFGIVTLLYFALAHKWRWGWLLLASCYFYMAFVPVYLLILAFTIAVDYAAGLLIERAQGTRRKLWLLISLVANIGVLVFFKYYGFLYSNAGWLAEQLHGSNPLPALSILLPIGLSFHTFQAMSYTIEVYRGHQPAEKHFGIYALYVMFYPQLVAGPIERPQNLLPQFRELHVFDADRVFSGLKLMVWGLFKKLVIADRLGIYVDSAYNYHEQSSGVSLLLATFFFSFQIYCDFSGYTDIAIGAARVMGFNLMTNFRRPLLARSTADHWRRWHISLSTWFRDYVYFPMGGSRVKIPRMYVNLMVVFLISGLWHGANWTFVIWGGLNGLYVVLGHITRRPRHWCWSLTGIPRHHRLDTFFQIIITFSLIAFSRVFFRSENLDQALSIFRKMAGMGGSLADESVTMLLYAFFAVGFLLAVECRREFLPDRFSLSLHRLPLVRQAWYAVLVLLILLVGVYDGGQFIYFQF